MNLEFHGGEKISRNRRSSKEKSLEEALVKRRLQNRAAYVPSSSLNCNQFNLYPDKEPTDSDGTNV
jgi:hypothetical protein